MAPESSLFVLLLCAILQNRVLLVGVMALSVYSVEKLPLGDFQAFPRERDLIKTIA